MKWARAVDWVRAVKWGRAVRCLVGGLVVAGILHEVAKACSGERFPSAVLFWIWGVAILVFWVIGAAMETSEAERGRRKTEQYARGYWDAARGVRDVPPEVAKLLAEWSLAGSPPPPPGEGR